MVTASLWLGGAIAFQVRKQGCEDAWEAATASSRAIDLAHHPLLPPPPPPAKLPPTFHFAAAHFSAPECRCSWQSSFLLTSAQLDKSSSCYLNVSGNVCE